MPEAELDQPGENREGGLAQKSPGHTWQDTSGGRVSSVSPGLSHVHLP